MASSTWWMSLFTRDVDAWTIGLTVGIQGMGFGFFSVSVTAMAFQTLSPVLRPDGTSFISLSRRLGSSVGVSLLISQLVRNTQDNRAGLLQYIAHMERMPVDIRRAFEAKDAENKRFRRILQDLMEKHPDLKMIKSISRCV